MKSAYLRKTLAVGLAVALVAGLPVSSFAQSAKKVDTPPDYRRTVYNPLRYYRPMSLPDPVLVNSPKIEQLIKDGKLYLSLEDAIVLALENNLDISVQRYTPELASLDLLRAQAGQGTPAGGFDPRLTGLLAWQRQTQPISNPFLAGTGVVTGSLLSALTNYNTAGNFTLAQGFHTGTSYAITWNNTRQSTTNPSTFFNPLVQSSLALQFSQPLLNGFGFLPNTRFIKIAENSKRIADLTFQSQLITTVSSVQQLYWDLVFFREDVKVKQRSVELAQRLYNDNKRQVEIGTLAPIEVVRAEAEVARTRQDLIVSQTNQLRQQTQIKNALAKRIMDPALAEVEVVPTDSVKDSPAMDDLPIAEAVKEAWDKRPDIKQARIDLESRGITRRATRNALLPTLNLNGSFSGVGLAGNTRNTTVTPTGTFTATSVPIVNAAGTPVNVGGVPVFTSTANVTTATSTASAGFGDALEIMRQFSFPTYGFSVNLNIPILNRAAQADNAQAMLLERQAETSLKRLENAIVVEVRNAQIVVEQSRASLEAARKSRELAQRTLDAEQKKYQLGASSIFFVIQAQRDLAAAESVELNSLVATVKAKVELERALGRTLDVNKITLADGKAGTINHTPNIPGTPTSDLAPGTRAQF